MGAINGASGLATQVTNAIGVAGAVGGTAWDNANALAGLSAAADASGNRARFLQELRQLNAAANASGNRAKFLQGLRICAKAGGC